MKPAQLVPCFLAVSLAVTAGKAVAQPAEEPVMAPAAPPAPLAPGAEPSPGAGPELPPPPPPRGAPPPPQGRLVISAPPVPPPRLRAGYHVHDGFYLRVAAGFGGGHASVSGDNSPNFGAGGAGLALNLWMGGTPARGVAVGGMASLQTLSESNTVVEGQETGFGSNGGSLLVGPFVDVFPDPMRGLHFGGSLALAFLGVEGDSRALRLEREVRDYSGGGLGASAWIGYMGFVGPEFSLGGLVQLTGYGTGQNEDRIERRGSGWALSVSLSALYH